ncbi:MAG TPA: kelch repeat-containing protein [Bryobacteraceae bacterium]
MPNINGYPGVYGTLGTPAAANIPGSRQSAVTWIDASGNLWIFGGNGEDSLSGPYFLNDLWEFNPSANQWAWMSGSSTITSSSGGQAGVYGTLGEAAPGNVPGGRYGAAGWIDTKGNLWLFGGWGCPSYPYISYYCNDLWRFNPSTSQWTWMGGSDTSDQPGVYGTQGTAATTNIPGAREYPASWTDKSGNFWLFGGYGYDSAGTLCSLNDLWRFNPTSGEWTWMSGSNTVPYASGQSGQCVNSGSHGVYGTLGTPGSGNTPGSRSSAVSWTDAGGNLWLFGGYGVDANGDSGYLNDLWEFSPVSNEWTWMGGSSTLQGSGGLPGQYATWMTPAAANQPGSRSQAVSWTDVNGNFWLLGGYGHDASGDYGFLNDLWEFNPSIHQWAWMSGSNIVAMLGNSPGYGTLGSPGFLDAPGAREGAAGWVDKSGNLWLFGGYGGGYLIGAGLYEWVAMLNDLWEYQPAAANLPVTAAPSFSPESGSSPAGETVTLSDPTPGAVIYYYTSGSTAAAQYAQPIVISSSETIQAVAAAPGYANSAVTSATYTIPIAVTPSFSISPGTYSTAQIVSISSATPGAVIYYTTNGLPTTSSNVYSGPITVSSSETIEAIAAAPGYASSVAAIASYTIWPTSAVNEWAWMGGVNTNEFAEGIYGAVGVPAPSNFPGDHEFSSTWVDRRDNLWLFGGLGGDASGNFGSLMNDLWKYNPSTNEWTWMGGSSSVGAVSNALGSPTNCDHGGCGQPGVYGTLGTPAAGNTPGGREGAASWTDTSGNFWLFGGYGFDSIGTLTELNDLWEFSPSTNEWTWMGGSSAATGTCFGSEITGFECAGEPSVYGTLGTPAAGNAPGARQGATSWTDSKGNLWLFGGWGWDFSTEAQYYFNELWEFTPSTRQWTWMGGSNTRAGSACFQNVNLYYLTCGEPGVYGIMATPSAGSTPGGRAGAVGWSDNDGNLWLFSGNGFDVNGNFGDPNDLWEFTPSNNEWAWMGGNSMTPACDDFNCGSGGTTGTYGTLGTPAAGNIPGGRDGAASWKDSRGNFWLFSGVVNDLWEFNPSANEWAWMGGTDEITCGVFCYGNGVYGTLGGPAAGNAPPFRSYAGTWTDDSGNLWLFGGDGDGPPNSIYLNDLWEYRPSAPAPVPGFALVDLSTFPFGQGGTLTVAAGRSGTTVINSVVSDGFNGSIALSAPNLPPGITVSFNPASITGFSSSQVTFTVAAATAQGEDTITVVGASGGLTETAPVLLTVGPSLPPESFTLTPSPGALVISPGNPGISTLTVFAWNGFNSAVSFACSGLPAGASCSFSPATVTLSGAMGSTATATLTISAATQAAALQPDSRPWASLTMLAGLVCLFGRRRRYRWHGMVVVLAGLVGVGLVFGCGGGGGGGSSQTNATVTVTGTSGSLQATTTISLTAN